MKLNTLFAINAVLLGFFGLTSLLTPDAGAAAYGLTLDPLSKHYLLSLGALYLGLAVLSWGARKVTDSNAHRAILLAFIVSYGISMIIAIIDILSGLGNALGWSSVAFYVLLIFGFGYYLFAKPSVS